MTDPIRDVVQKIIEAAPQKQAPPPPQPEPSIDEWWSDGRTLLAVLLGFLAGATMSMTVVGMNDPRPFPFDMIFSFIALGAGCFIAIVLLSPKE